MEAQEEAVPAWVVVVAAGSVAATAVVVAADADKSFFQNYQSLHKKGQSLLNQTLPLWVGECQFMLSVYYLTTVADVKSLR